MWPLSIVQIYFQNGNARKPVLSLYQGIHSLTVFFVFKLLESKGDKLSNGFGGIEKKKVQYMDRAVVARGAWGAS